MHPVNLGPRIGQGNSGFHAYYELSIERRISVIESTHLNEFEEIA
jgi:hypothetical protein